MRRVIVVSAVLLLLGGCGGSDGPAPSAAAETPSSADATAFDPCEAISAQEVGAIIDGTVTAEVGPFDACEYDQEDPRATSVAIDSQAESELGGGYEVYKSGSAAALTDAEVTELPGIGESAFVVTGRFGDGDNTQLQGAALVDGVVVTVNLTQAAGLAAQDLVDQATQLLQLAAAKV